MKRNVRKIFWSTKIQEYRYSGMLLFRMVPNDEGRHPQFEMLASQAVASQSHHTRGDRLSLVCSERIKGNSISLEANHVEVEVDSGYNEEFLLD